jgi:hypothetical protein
MYTTPIVKYIGRIPQKKSTDKAEYIKANRGYILVTVGSTSFDSLIQAIDTSILTLLQKKGYSGIRIFTTYNIQLLLE